MIRLRTESIGARRPSAFATSVLWHLVVVVYLFAMSSYAPDGPKLSLYEQEIRPHERELVWYNLQTKLPAIRTADAAPSKRPPRAAEKAPKRIVSGQRDDSMHAQKVWMPDAPKVDAPKPKPLPNLLAVAPPAPEPPAPKPVKRFTPPPKPAVTPAPQTLADAPKLAETPAAVARLDVNLAAPRRTAKRFSPHAPKLATALPAPALADAPQIVRAPASIAKLDVTLAAPRGTARRFAPPAVRRAEAKGLAAMDAPPVPDVSLPPTPGATATLAIVGLDPAKSMKVPEPPAPRDAGFSAGPKPDPTGSESVAAPRGAVSIPDLAAEATGRNARAAPSAELSAAARQNLLAAMRMGAGLNPMVPLGGAPRALAPHVSSSPDPRMAGRDVYSMAIQMPNVTSYSGSWMVWFAERHPDPERRPQVRGPEPLRKVDPKYNADAVRDGVQGIVRLTAVIHKDGSIDTIELLKHLDTRLDATAEEALSKWRFNPATRDGEPVDVDAVFEVPFHLPPKETR